MGQDSTWHLRQLNQYVSIFNNSISHDSTSQHHSNRSNRIDVESKARVFFKNNHSSSLSSAAISSSTTTTASTSTTLTSSSSVAATVFTGSLLSSSVALSSESNSVPLFNVANALAHHRQSTNTSTLLVEKLTATALQLVASNDERKNSSEKYFDGIDDDAIDTSNWLLFVLIAFYCVVVFGGIFGNASLVITLYTQSSARLRNPLLVALCLADLMVSSVAAPLTIVTIFFGMHKTWSHSSDYACKSIHFMQSMPVAASTICLFMLSLDRFATVKHPRLAQLRQRRFLPFVLSFASWIAAIIVSIPILIAYKITSSTQYSNINNTINADSLLQAPKTDYTISSSTTTSTSASTTIEIASLTPLNSSGLIDSNVIGSMCQPEFSSLHTQAIVYGFYTLFVFILPGIGVALNHLGVRQKLCALSLTARAAHGELPLPMPILRRPTHMIIVTGMANAAAVRDDDDSSNDENNQQRDERRHMMDSTKLKATPRTPRSLRYGHSIRTHSQNPRNVPPSEFPLPQTSTLRARRRLANMLVAGSLVFILCWTPHVICLLCSKVSSSACCSRTATNFYLLLGYTHSALNPILHWALNHNSLRQSSFLLRLTTVQRFLRAHIRDRHHQPPPSSTNEAALGPFNPRYIKARPQYQGPPASSHLLY